MKKILENGLKTTKNSIQKNYEKYKSTRKHSHYIDRLDIPLLFTRLCDKHHSCFALSFLFESQQQSMNNDICNYLEEEMEIVKFKDFEIPIQNVHIIDMEKTEYGDTIIHFKYGGVVCKSKKYKKILC